MLANRARMAPADRRVWPTRAACAWSAVCGYRDRSARQSRQQRGRLPLRGGSTLV